MKSALPCPRALSSVHACSHALASREEMYTLAPFWMKPSLGGVRRFEDISDGSNLPDHAANAFRAAGNEHDFALDIISFTISFARQCPLVHWSYIWPTLTYLDIEKT
jgi:hypothetical protein